MPNDQGTPVEYHRVRQVVEDHVEEILKKPNVVGVGLGYKTARGRQGDSLCVVALVEQKVPRSALAPGELIPEEVDGVKTDVRQVGQLRALQARTDRWRPAPGGVSIGHYNITAGTLGCLVRDRVTGEKLILSNNHVLADSNAGRLGDPILQPGAFDGGRLERDSIARLERFCPIEYLQEPSSCSIANLFTHLVNFISGLLGSRHQIVAIRLDQTAANRVDAAVARPLEEDLVKDELLDIGPVAGHREPQLGMRVRKSGRTTAYTTGEIVVLDATVNVQYGRGREARFIGQIVTTPMSQGGDSGSLLVDAEAQEGIGLLFAGSDQATIHNPISDVLECLEIDL